MEQATAMEYKPWEMWQAREECTSSEVWNLPVAAVTRYGDSSIQLYCTSGLPTCLTTESLNVCE